jgi:TetR/AcrR family tetracycline transcriptional repressor
VLPGEVDVVISALGSARATAPGTLLAGAKLLADLPVRTLALGAGRGVPLRQARVIVLTVVRFTVGHVLEEQAPRPDEAALMDFDMAAFTERHPTIIAGVAEYLQDGRTVEDLFRECLEVVMEGSSATTRGAIRALRRPRA